VLLLLLLALPFFGLMWLEGNPELSLYDHRLSTYWAQPATAARMPPQGFSRSRVWVISRPTKERYALYYWVVRVGPKVYELSRADRPARPGVANRQEK
jgi:hypothetical protein